ncbi:MAG: flagellar export chaperone FliS [Myxococcota bacterium]|jgi:flagellar protein FliS|nr:flagellar export chaperone FliS [Myxococcota bacterium]
MYKVSYQQQAYRKVHVETSNPGQILIALYDAAIRNIQHGIERIDKRDYPGKGVALNKAYAIIAEFINALDFSVAPELCANLEGIYTFMLDQISEANTNMNSEPLQPVLRHLQSLRATWAEAVARTANENSEAAAAGVR